MSARRVELVSAEVIRPLSHRVLRGGQPAEAASYAEDSLSTTLHVAAYDERGEVVACATFFPEDYEGAPAWRLRGMASDPTVRGQGYGARTLLRGTDEARTRGAMLLWCNARTSAVGFYEQHGWRRVGEEFDVAKIGPHYRMVRELPTG